MKEDIKYLGEKFPMGVTQWADYGKALGYWDYFKKEVAELARLERDTEWKEKIEKKSVDELLDKMGDAYKDYSVQVAYKEGYNRALDDLISSMK